MINKRNTNKGAAAVVVIVLIVVVAVLAFLIGKQYEVTKDESSTNVSVNATSTVTSTSTSTTTNSTWPATIAVKAGQTGAIGGLSITFNQFLQDYRCPVDVQCIQAGAVVINVTFSAGGKTKTLNMPSDEVPQTFEGYSIAIRDVKPDLYAGRTIQNRDYVITFEVSR